MYILVKHQMLVNKAYKYGVFWYILKALLMKVGLRFNLARCLIFEISPECQRFTDLGSVR